jgi:hypothetical protein
MVVPADPGGPDATKACPDCAEIILGAARVCRFCGYRFDVGLSAPEAARAVSRRDKSPFAAAVMSFLVPGLGQAYLSEWSRGAAFFGSFWTMLVAAIYTDTIGLAWLIGLIAAVDAYRGAVEVKEAAAPRAVTGRVWLLVAVSAGLSIAGMVNYEEPSNGGGQSMREFRFDNYDRCISTGLSELECGRIYLDY